MLAAYMTTVDNLTVKQLRKLIAIKEKIETLQDKIQSIAGGGSSDPYKRRGRRNMSRAARTAIAAAQRARWAKVKGSRRKAAPKKHRKVSAAGRARMAAAARARWAKVKAQGKKGP
jgi:hypothetical protein